MIPHVIVAAHVHVNPNVEVIDLIVFGCSIPEPGLHGGMFRRPESMAGGSYLAPLSAVNA